MRTVWLALVATLGLSGCDVGLLSTACTLIGCLNGLSVTLANAPAGPFAVEVRRPGASTLRHECESAARCGVLQFPDVVDAAVTIAIITSDGEVTRSVRPAYVRSRPNGPRCEPTCWRAEVTV